MIALASAVEGSLTSKELRVIEPKRERWSCMFT